jgi:hypothetical protein
MEWEWRSAQAFFAFEKELAVVRQVGHFATEHFGLWMWQSLRSSGQ